MSNVQLTATNTNSVPSEFANKNKIADLIEITVKPATGNSKTKRLYVTVSGKAKDFLNINKNDRIECAFTDTYFAFVMRLVKHGGVKTKGTSDRVNFQLYDKAFNKFEDGTCWHIAADTLKHHDANIVTGVLEEQADMIWKSLITATEASNSVFLK